MATICITGVGGYLGQATALALIKDGNKVIGLGSNAERPESLCESVKYFAVDIRDRVLMANIFETESIDVVYHFAAIKYVGLCEKDPDTCFSVNTEGTRSVVEAMSYAQVPKIVYASTYAVYDWVGDKVELNENSPTNPKTVYGQSKLQAEEIIQQAYKDKIISEYQIMRYGNIIGFTSEAPLSTPQSFIDKLVAASRTGESVTLSGNTFATVDGTVARDFIDVRDVVSVNSLIVHERESGIYNISSGSTTTLGQVINILENLSGKSITHSFTERSPGEPSVITISNQKAKELLKWKPEFSAQKTIEFLYKTSSY